MRYCLVTYDYPPSRGGVARYNKAIVDALAPPSTAMVLSRSFYWLFHLPRLLRIPRDITCITSEVIPLGTMLWIRCVLGRGEYHVVVHGLDVLAPFAKLRKRWLIRNVLSRAQTIIANSNATAEIAQRYFASRRTIAIVPPPCNEQVDGIVETPRRLMNVLSVGRLIQRKGFDVLIHAMRQVQQKYPQATLTILGDGPMRSALEHQMEMEGVRGKIIVDADDALLRHQYEQCAVFAMLPRSAAMGDMEGFGIVYLEASAHGKPVVGTASGGVPEAICDEQTGIIVPPDDAAAAARAILRLLDDPHAAAALGARGRLWVQTEFTFTRFQERIRAALAV